jgi:hypothetical protein
VSQFVKLHRLLFCHSGLDPESSSVSRHSVSGCRIKSGMTSRIQALFELRRSLAGGNPEMFCQKSWIPAFAGMTGKTPRLLSYLKVKYFISFNKEREFK